MSHPPPHQNPPWSDLPTDLLELIANRHLQFADHVRFGAVCKSWRSSITTNHHHRLRSHLQALKIPWLVVVSFRRRHTGLFSPVEDQFYNNRKLKARRTDNAHDPYHCIVGSSKGWLVTYSHLLNPFTNKKIELAIAGGRHASKWKSVNKAVLSSEPSPHNLAAGNPCTVAGIYRSSKLIFFRPENSKWSVVKHKLASLRDVVFVDGRLYCIDAKHGVVVLEAFESTYRQQAYISPDPVPSKPDHRYKVLHLVECAGEVLLVVEYLDDDFLEIHDLGVYRLDFSGPRWTEMRSLGDKMLLLDYVRPLCVDAADFDAAGFSRNCIYFTEGDGNRCQWRVFCLEDKRIRSFCPATSYRVSSRHLWLHPDA